MIKVIGFMRKKQGLTLKAFERYWHEEHAPLGFKVLPEDIQFIRYVQHYAIPLQGLGNPPYDGVAEFCFQDTDMFQKWLAWFMSDGGKPLRDDEGNFMDSTSVTVTVMEERVIIPDDGARGDGIKLISGVKRKRGLTLNQFKDYWHEKHAPLALSVLPKSPFVKKYVHNYAIPVEGFGEPAFDGIGELCFDDMEAFHKSTEWFMGEGGEVLREDEENFVDPTTRVVVIVRQRVIIP